jgi:hypothetical protein
MAKAPRWQELRGKSDEELTQLASTTAQKNLLAARLRELHTNQLDDTSQDRQAPPRRSRGLKTMQAERVRSARGRGEDEW